MIRKEPALFLIHTPALVVTWVIALVVLHIRMHTMLHIRLHGMHIRLHMVLVIHMTLRVRLPLILQCCNLPMLIYRRHMAKLPVSLCLSMICGAGGNGSQYAALRCQEKLLDRFLCLRYTSPDAKEGCLTAFMV